MRAALKGLGSGALAMSLVLAVDFGGHELRAQIAGAQQGDNTAATTSHRTTAPAATTNAAQKPAATESTRHWYTLPKTRSTAASSVTKPTDSATGGQGQAASDEAQRKRDAELLKQQQAESQKVQQQQDHQAAELVKQQQKQDAETRILDVPRQSGMTPVAVPETSQGPARIQDAPIPPPSSPPQPPLSSTENIQQQTTQPQQQK
jgi:hypothetical protein